MARKSHKTPATKARKAAPKPETIATPRLSSVEPNDLLLVDQVVALARVSRWTLRRLEQAGRFPSPMKVGFKRIAWRAAEVEAWRAGTWTPPTAQPQAA